MLITPTTQYLGVLKKSIKCFLWCLKISGFARVCLSVCVCTWVWKGVVCVTTTAKGVSGCITQDKWPRFDALSFWRCVFFVSHSLLTFLFSYMAKQRTNALWPQLRHQQAKNTSRMWTDRSVYEESTLDTWDLLFGWLRTCPLEPSWRCRAYKSTYCPP